MKKIALAMLISSLAVPAMAGQTLDAVKKRGHLICGVNTSAPAANCHSPDVIWY